jgi:hypothetical protein
MSSSPVFRPDTRMVDSADATAGTPHAGGRGKDPYRRSPPAAWGCCPPHRGSTARGCPIHTPLGQLTPLAGVPRQGQSRPAQHGDEPASASPRLAPKPPQEANSARRSAYRRNGGPYDTPAANPAPRHSDWRFRGASLRSTTHCQQFVPDNRPNTRAGRPVDGRDSTTTSAGWITGGSMPDSRPTRLSNLV